METWEIEAIVGSVRHHKTVEGSYYLAVKVSNIFPPCAIISYTKRS